MDTPHNASNEAPSGDTAAWAELLTRQNTQLRSSWSVWVFGCTQLTACWSQP